MHSEFDRTQSDTFVHVARDRQLLDEAQAKTLLLQSAERSVMSSRLAIETGILNPVEVEIVEAFTTPKDLAPGYELLDVLGFGALGVVYRARQPHLQRDVAIKAIKQSKLSQQNVIARFHQEGAAIGRLHHPNIVSAFDSGSHRNRLYLVMELVHGTDLRKRIDQTRIDVPTALSIVRQTASGLAHALSHRIIHRDIKPGNLILTEAPAGFDLPAGIPLVKIADFGLAKLNPPGEAEQDETQLTMAGAALGTPMYSSPEQLTGDPVDHRADIYALGATLFHILAGQPPFKAATVSKLIVAKITGQPPRLELLPPDLEPVVRQLLLSMMEHDPDQRVQDYETLIQRVDQMQRSTDGSAPDPTMQTLPDTPPTRRRFSKRAFVPAIAVLIAVILTALFVPNLLRQPVSPSMVPNGTEEYLFNGTLNDWAVSSGSWMDRLDDEGGVVLAGGSGSAVRRLPDWSEAGFALGHGVRINIELQNAAAAEIHFGLTSDETESTKSAKRLVARVTKDDVSLGTREGIEGEFVRLGGKPVVSIPSEDAPSYHQISIEMHGQHWFVYFDDDLFANANADPAANNRVIELVAINGTVHFEGPTVFGLKTKVESGG